MSLCPKPAATDLHTAINRLKEELAGTYAAQQDGTATDITINGAITLDEDAIASLCESLSSCIPDVSVDGGTFDADTLVLTLTQDDGGPDITIDLGELSKSYTENTDTITFEGDGTQDNPLKATSTDDPMHYFSVNDGGTELGNFNNEASELAGLGSIVVGPDSTATTAGTIVVGHGASSDRKGADGFTDVDGDVVIGQFASSKSTAGAFPSNYGADFLTQPNIVIGRNANADVPAGSAILIGVDATAEAFAGTAIGYRAKASGIDGNDYYGTYGLQGGCTAIGSFAEAVYSGELQGNLPDDNTSSCPTAFGSLSKSLADGAGAFGDCSQALALRATCVGSMSQATEQHSVAVGSLSIANRGASTDATTEQGYGGYNPITKSFGGDPIIDATTSTHGAISVGKNTDSRIEFTINYTDSIADTIFTQVGNIRRQIINVAAGTKDTDAVNVAQLKAVSKATSPTYEGNYEKGSIINGGVVESWFTTSHNTSGSQLKGGGRYKEIMIPIPTEISDKISNIVDIRTDIESIDYDDVVMSSIDVLSHDNNQIRLGVNFNRTTLSDSDFTIRLKITGWTA